MIPKYNANKRYKNAFISTFVTNFYSGDFARFFNLKEQKHDQRMRVLTIFGCKIPTLEKEEERKLQLSLLQCPFTEKGIWSSKGEMSKVHPKDRPFYMKQ